MTDLFMLIDIIDETAKKIANKMNIDPESHKAYCMRGCLSTSLEEWINHFDLWDEYEGINKD